VPRCQEGLPPDLTAADRGPEKELVRYPTGYPSGANQTRGSRFPFSRRPAKAGVRGCGAERAAPCSSQGQALGARFRGQDGKGVRVPNVQLTPLVAAGFRASCC
jgi:hypothetical protein